MPGTRHVATIGVFDGVHRGQRVLVSAARKEADRRGLAMVVVTFDPHPLAIVSPEGPPKSLASVDRRVELLRSAGADDVLVLTFDEKLQATEPEDFVREVLVGRLDVAAVAVGEDFRFGRRARGDVSLLSTMGAELGFDVIGVPLAGDSGTFWSSTLVRRLISDGDVATAADMLGRPYELTGTVVHGDARGRTLGFPTANLGWTGSPTLPADGVYAGFLSDGDHRWSSAISVGTNPQFHTNQRRVETYVIDQTGLDLYDKPITLEFIDRVRGQLTFPDVDGLVVQMHKDVDSIRTLLSA
ncbi:MAG: bifunctional riboflavin kinase/FAD synthetase [Actinomycetes bacterium]